MSIQVNNVKLAPVARIAHKYHFSSIEFWALQSLTVLHKQHTEPIPTSHLMQITETAVLCDSAELLDVVIVKWKRLLGEGKEVPVAIQVAERFNLRGLLGLAYNSMMLKGRAQWESDSRLTRTQRIRLLSGHYNLLKLCEELSSSPPRFTHDSTCIGQGKVHCKKAWTSLWKTIHSGKSGIIGQAVTLQSADLVGNMMMAESIVKALAEGSIPDDGLLDSMQDSCLKLALTSTEKKVKDMQDNLADLFTDIS